MKYDVFISYAQEDEEVAILLARKLEDFGINVFLAKYKLQIGDSLFQQINHALTESRFGVPIVSPVYLSKKWPMRELGAILAREDAEEMDILPVLHNLTSENLKQSWPLLADKLTVSTNQGLDQVATQILNVVNLKLSTLQSHNEEISAAESRKRFSKLNRLGPLLTRYRSSVVFAA
jgi:TIR domain.